METGTSWRCRVGRPKAGTDGLRDRNAECGETIENGDADVELGDLAIGLGARKLVQSSSPAPPSGSRTR
jgi:hypothetical protein